MASEVGNNLAFLLVADARINKGKLMLKKEGKKRFVTTSYRLSDEGILNSKGELVLSYSDWGAKSSTNPFERATLLRALALSYGNKHPAWEEARKLNLIK